MSREGTRGERKIKLSKDICVYNLQTMRQRLGDGESEKGTEEEIKVWFSQDICGFSLRTLWLLLVEWERD